MKICSINGCDKKLLSKGLCSAHYWRMKRNGSPLIFINQSNKNKKCSVNGCENESSSKGYCSTHYIRFLKHGNPHIVGDRSIPVTFEVDDNGCFNCTSHSKHKFGYSMVAYNGKETCMHRKVYAEMFGPIPEGYVVRHKCDNPSCINPEHLELGTPEDNQRDKVIRGRVPKGEEAGTSKLKEYEVLEIINLLDKGEKKVDIAKRYKVSDTAIRDIDKRRTWKHIQR